VTLLITAGPPTSNGDLHIGHLAGPYIAGDIFARFMTMNGHDVRYISATDDHQSYVALKAAQKQTSPEELVGLATETIIATLRKAQVDMALFARPACSARYQSFIQSFLVGLYERGALVRIERPTPWCSYCEQFRFEAHVRGRCPRCESEADGGICEACGYPVDGVKLLDAHCVACGKSVTARPLLQLVFPLDRYRKVLSGFVERYAVSPAVRNGLLRSILEEPLSDVPVTISGEWGIPVPVSIDGCEGQRISAWFELGPQYLAVTDLLCEKEPVLGDWRELWGSLPKVVQFFGYDSAYFHGILFPALFYAYDPNLGAPRGFGVNMFYQLRKKKFSTSRNHALWGGQFLEEYSSDLLRLYVSFTRPEAEQTNFDEDEYEKFALEQIEAWSAFCGLRAPLIVPAAEAIGPEHERFEREVNRLAARVTEALKLEGFSPARAARGLCAIVEEGNRFLKEFERGRGTEAGEAEWLTAVNFQLRATRLFALLCAPVLPTFAESLWRAVGGEGAVHAQPWETAMRPIRAGAQMPGSTEQFLSFRRKTVSSI